MPKQNNHRIKALIAATAFALGACLAMATPASAHDNPRDHTIFHHTASWQTCWLNIGVSCDMAQLQNGHVTMLVDDRECDNNSVRAEYYRSGISGMRTLYANGCHGGPRTATDRSHPVTKMRLCEANSTCTPWHTT